MQTSCVAAPCVLRMPAHVPIRLPDAGYAWQCAYCACGQHLGWKFTAARPELVPPSFWGLRRPALQAGGPHDMATLAGGFLHGGDGSSEDGD